MKKKALFLIMCMCLFGSIGCGGDKKTPDTTAITQALRDKAKETTDDTEKSTKIQVETTLETELSAYKEHYDPVKANLNINQLKINEVEFSNIKLVDESVGADVRFILSGEMANKSNSIKEYGFSYTLYYDDGEIFLSEALSNYNYSLKPGESIAFAEEMTSSSGAKKTVTGFSINGLVPTADSIETVTNNEQEENHNEADSDNPLMALEISVGDVMNGFKTEKIGEWAEVEIDKEIAKSLTQEQFMDFCKSVIDGSGYNWFVILFEDGTGIQFAGSIIGAPTYGKIDVEGCVEEVIGYIIMNEDGYKYSPAS